MPIDNRLRADFRSLLILLALIAGLSTVPDAGHAQAPDDRPRPPITVDSAANLTLLHTWTYHYACPAWSPDGAILAIDSPDALMLQDVHDLNAEPQVFEGLYPCPPLFSPDGKELVAAPARSAGLVEIVTGDVGQIFLGHTDTITSLAISPDGTRIATSAGDYSTRVWDTATGESLFVFDHDGQNVIYPASALAFSPDGTLLAAATRFTVHVWDVESGEWVARLSTGTTPDTVLFNADGSRLAVGSVVNASFGLWDTATWENVAGGISYGGLTFSPDGAYLALTGTTALEIRDALTGEIVTQIDQSPLEVAYNPDGTILAGATYEGDLMLWDAGSGGLLALFHPDDSRATALAFSPDGTLLVTASSDDSVRLWGVDAGGG